MSAWMLSHAHRNQLVRVAIWGPAPDGWQIGNYAFSFYHEQLHHKLRLEVDDPIEHLAHGIFTQRLIGPAWLERQLYDANVLSVRSRYSDANECEPFPSAPSYRRPVMTAVEALKAIACLNYQSCEFPQWESSLAYSFTDALRSNLVAHVPGYEQAPWDWSAADVIRRKSEATR